MSSLYSKYIKERENVHIIETPEGFVTYKYFPDQSECYVLDIYVIPNKRNLDIASTLLDQISKDAKVLGYKFLTSSVVPSTNNSTGSLRFHLAYGFKLLRSEDDKIWIIKELI